MPFAKIGNKYLFITLKKFSNKGFGEREHPVGKSFKVPPIIVEPIQ
jgi:hypothetical protein